MADLVINNKLNNTLVELSVNPPSAMLLSGPKGSGKKVLLDYFAKLITKNDRYAKIIKVELLEDKKHILIDQIKEIKNLLKNKDNSYRIILIPDADLMTSDTQNSLLKILEEPPKNVVFLLSSSLPHLLLRTIRSRVISLKYIKPTYSQISEYASQLDITDEDIKKFYTISRGRMGIISALINGDYGYSILNDIENAKDVLSEPAADRLKRVDIVSKDYNSAIRLLESLLIVCEAALEHAVNKGQYQQWLKRLQAVNEAYNLLLKNVSTKLVLAKLFLVL